MFYKNWTKVFCCLFNYKSCSYLSLEWHSLNLSLYYFYISFRSLPQTIVFFIISWYVMLLLLWLRGHNHCENYEMRVVNLGRKNLLVFHFHLFILWSCFVFFITLIIQPRTPRSLKMPYSNRNLGKNCTPSDDVSYYCFHHYHFLQKQEERNNCSPTTLVINILDIF